MRPPNFPGLRADAGGYLDERSAANPRQGDAHQPNSLSGTSPPGAAGGQQDDVRFRAAALHRRSGGLFLPDYIKYAEPSLVLDAKDEEGFHDMDMMLLD